MSGRIKSFADIRRDMHRQDRNDEWRRRAEIAMTLIAGLLIGAGCAGMGFMAARIMQIGAPL